MYTYWRETSIVRKTWHGHREVESEMPDCLTLPLRRALNFLREVFTRLLQTERNASGKPEGEVDGDVSAGNVHQAPTPTLSTHTPSEQSPTAERKASEKRGGESEGDAPGEAVRQTPTHTPSEQPPTATAGNAKSKKMKRQKCEIAIRITDREVREQTESC